MSLDPIQGCLLQVPRVFLQKMIEKSHNVFPPLPEWGQSQAHTIDSKIQFFAKPARLDIAFEASSA